ncbi:MAG: hypothetical protein RI983_1665 [Bacteroidota bacterium]|jgi:arabinose-5-phosphate isomerase
MNKHIQNIALQTIDIEMASIQGLKEFINEDFKKIIQAIHQTKGRLIVSGIGKSAIVAQKIVATLNSTGTPALFMHAADAIHGDLGMITSDDVVMLISKSGESPEIKVLIPLINNFGNLLIGMVGNMDSYLAQKANLVINTSVEREACPNNLAPTSSTTAQMVMGDVLAVCLMELNQFNNRDFARFHPGGNLGKRLYLRVDDLSENNQKPAVLPTASLKEIIVEITQNRLGVTAVVNEENLLIGIITDGDLRRMLEKTSDISTICAANILSPAPITISPQAMAVEALDVMRKKDISQLIVSENSKYMGIIHLHDLIREGIV